MLKPSFRQVLRDADRPCVGLWNATASPVAMEILALSGADFIVIDGEHGPLSCGRYWHFCRHANHIQQRLLCACRGMTK